MHPVLFNVFGIPINTFGVMIAISAMIGSMVFCRRASIIGINSERAWDLVFWSIILGTLGARITYILLNLSYFIEHQNEFFTLRFEGLTSYGALITGIPTVIYWSKKHNISPAKLLDAGCVPYLIGHAIGRIGCFFNGCCYGCYSDKSWGVVFPNIGNRTHYPTQLYDTFLTLLAILVIILLEKRRLLKQTQSWYLSLIFYNAIRIFEEIWRQGPGGTSSTVISVFSLAQLVGILLLLIFGILFLRASNSNFQKTL